jgi:hypothetical protein
MCHVYLPLSCLDFIILSNNDLPGGGHSQSVFNDRFLDQSDPETRGKMRSTFLVGIFLVILLVLFLAFFSDNSDNADAIPAFARKYKTSCVLCHAPFPRLTAMGEAFRLNGYKIPEGDEIYVKEEPVSLGAEAYKKVFPEDIWQAIKIFS